MKSYSQNNEDLFVLDYFKGFKGTLLEIGANDGHTLSNSLLLIENGWKAWLVEPSSAFYSLEELHKDNKLVHCCYFGIGEKDETVKFYESGAHVIGGSDKALVSSVYINETDRWKKQGVEFTEKETVLISWNRFSDNNFILDFISIDAEGMDWQILKQIDLTAVGCKCLCIEFNGDKSLEVQFTNYCALHGLKLAHVNNENLLFVR